jgi:NADH-quinone oxidoreductase subunit H
MGALLFFLVFIPLFALLAVYAERKVSAFVQDRIGPSEVGYYGLLQTFADILKLVLKEDIVPAVSDKLIFRIAPAIIFTSVFAGYAVLPLAPSIQGSSIESGVFFLLTVVSMDVIGLIMAGWGSNNKFSLYGSMRSVAQIISYEVPLTLSVLSVCIISQTLDLQEISFQQGIYMNMHPGLENERNFLFGIKATGIDITETGGILSWNIIRMPLLGIGFIIFFISSLAESNRAPFDIPEAESELVAGFHTEYAGFRWAILFLAEYGMMLLVCFLASILYLGSWNTPFPDIGPLKLATWTSGNPDSVAGNIWGIFWLLSKALLLIFIQMMARWTYPRLRVDQLMYLCWKILTPAAIVLLLLSAVWRLLMV